MIEHMADVPGAPTPEGWYEDPESAAQLRWWDGLRWTDQRRPKPGAGLGAGNLATALADDPLAALQRARKEPTPGSPNPFLIVAIAMAVGVVVWGTYVVISSGGGERSTTVTTAGPGNAFAPVAAANDAAAQADLSRAAATALILMQGDRPSGQGGSPLTVEQFQQAEPTLSFGPPGSATAGKIAVRSTTSTDVYLISASPSGNFLCVHVGPGGRTYGEGETEDAAALRCNAASW